MTTVNRRQPCPSAEAMAKTHISRAMVKLGARDRAQLVALAYQHRLVDPPDPTPPTAG